jgi:hypothetical protein
MRSEISGSMRHRPVALAFLLLASCARGATTGGTAVPTPSAATPPATGGTVAGPACCTREVLGLGLRIAEQNRVAEIETRRFTHAAYWRAIGPSIRSSVFRVDELGKSINGREIRSITFGRGPTSVLLWSQMHGDESTASMALADIFRFLAAEGEDPLRTRLREQLTITFVPMLNPDGAELFQRENAVGIDVNRDARALSTPEGRILKSLRDRLRPHYGFNLHDQNARTRVGQRGPQAAIALLAPAFDEARGWNDVRTRARLVAASVARVLAHEIPGRVAKYDDAFNARAFGDLMQQWGTSTVLIESGAMPNDPQKQRLRAMNVAAILAALDAIATRSYTNASTGWYDDLPFNAGGASDLIVLGGQIVLPGKPPLRADIAINYDDAVARLGGRVREVGDLAGVVAIDTIDANGLFLHPSESALQAGGGGAWLRLGARAEFLVRRSADPSSEVMMRIGGQQR